MDVKEFRGIRAGVGVGLGHNCCVRLVVELDSDHVVAVELVGSVPLD